MATETTQDLAQQLSEVMSLRSYGHDGGRSYVSLSYSPGELQVLPTAKIHVPKSQGDGILSLVADDIQMALDGAGISSSRVKSSMGATPEGTASLNIRFDADTPDFAEKREKAIKLVKGIRLLQRASGGWHADMHNSRLGKGTNRHGMGMDNPQVQLQGDSVGIVLNIHDVDFTQRGLPAGSLPVTLLEPLGKLNGRLEQNGVNPATVSVRTEPNKALGPQGLKVTLRVPLAQCERIGGMSEAELRAAAARGRGEARVM